MKYNDFGPRYLDFVNSTFRAGHMNKPSTTSVRRACSLLAFLLLTVSPCLGATPETPSADTTEATTSPARAQTQEEKSLNRLRELILLSGSQLKEARYREAHETLLETLNLAEKLNQSAVTASACYRLGLAARRLDGPEAALPYYERAIALSEADNPSLNALARNTAAQSLNRLNRHQEALQLLGPAAERARTLAPPGNVRLQAKIHGNAAVAEYHLGEYLLALEHLDLTLSLFSATGDCRDQNIAALHRANTLTQLGRFRAAQAAYSQVAEDAFITGDIKTRADALSGLGMLHQYMGDQEQAIAFLSEALQGHQQHNDLPAVAHDHMTVAAVHVNLRKFDVARAHYACALDLYEYTGSHAHKGFALANRGLTHLLSGDPKKARNDIEASMRTLSKSENPREIAIAYEYMGRTDLALGRHGDARQYFLKALKLARYMDRPETIWRAEAGLGELYETTGHKSAAAAHFLAAVQAIESVRKALPTGFPTQDYLYDKHRVYNALIRTLLAVNDKYAALSSLDERNRWAARHLFATSPEFESPLRKSLFEKERVLSARLAAYKEAVRRSNGNAGISPGETDRLRQEASAVRKERQNLLSQIRRQDPILYHGLATEPLDVEKLVGHLQEGVAVVAYFFSGSDLHLFYVTRGALEVKALRGVQPSILAAIRELRTSVQRPPRHETLHTTRQAFLQASARLHELLIAPLPDTVQKAHKWYVLPDDQLWAVPFMGLLAGNGRFVAEDHAVVAINTLEEVTGGNRPYRLFSRAPSCPRPGQPGKHIAGRIERVTTADKY